jgi:hypothetical protein
MGWGGELVEPSPAALAKLVPLYENDPAVNVYKFAIGETSGMVDFYESDWHLKADDVALLSTTSPGQAQKWSKHKKPDGTTQAFTPKKVRVLKWADTPFSALHYDFISIDAEGADWGILKQIDLSAVMCVCIEYGDKNTLRLIREYCKGFGLKERHVNYENAIFTR